MMALFGIAYQRTVIRAILPRSWHVQLIATLATSIVLHEPRHHRLRHPAQGGAHGAVLARPRRGRLPHGWQRLLVLAASLADLLGARPVRRAHPHRQGHARDVAEPRGVRGGGRGRAARGAVTFALSAALAAAAAALVSPLFNIFPDMGAMLTLKAFAAVVAGGFGYVNGAIAASFLIGITEALAGSYISYAYKDAIAFLIMIAVLLWRPQGLFGRRIGI